MVFAQQQQQHKELKMWFGLVSLALALGEDTHRFSSGVYTNKAWFNLAIIWVDGLFFSCLWD